MLQGEERQEFRQLMDRINKSIQIRPQPQYHREQFDMYGRSIQASEPRSAEVPAPGGKPGSLQGNQPLDLAQGP